VSTTWQEIPPPGHDVAGERAVPVIAALVAAGAVALLGWWSERPLLMVVAPVAVIGLSQLTALSPRLGRVVARMVGWIAHWVGEVLSLLLLGVTFVVVFIPLHLLGRLFSHDLARQPGDRWQSRRRSRGPALFGREFGDDRTVTAHLRRGRVAVATLVLVLVAGIWFVASRDGGSDRLTLTGIDGASGPTQTHDPFVGEALADDEWAREANDATGEMFAQRIPDAFLGYRLPPRFESTYVNVEDGRRLTYTPADLPQDPLVVWFFGGSTAFGNTQQRDEHTIASELARLSEEAGRPLLVRNYGVPGYTAWQESLLLAQELAEGGEPDVVVFYDGFNDTVLQVGSMAMGYENAGRQAHVMAQSMAEAAREAWGLPDPPRRIITPDDPVPDRAAFVAQVVDTISQASELRQAMADTYDFTLVQTWQPDLFSKNLSPGEEAMLPALGLEGLVFTEWQHLTDDIRADLPDEVTDLGTAFDGHGSVMADPVHTNEEGALLIAEAIWPQVEQGLPAR